MEFAGQSPARATFRQPLVNRIGGRFDGFGLAL
jgi:hypothetical protein